MIIGYEVPQRQATSEIGRLPLRSSSTTGNGKTHQGKQEHRLWKRFCEAEPELRNLERAIRSSRPPAGPLSFFVSWRTWKRVLAAFAGPQARVPALRGHQAEKFSRAWLWLVLDAAHPMGKRPSGAEVRMSIATTKQNDTSAIHCLDAAWQVVMQ